MEAIESKGIVDKSIGGILSSIGDKEPTDDVASPNKSCSSSVNSFSSQIV